MGRRNFGWLQTGALAFVLAGVIWATGHIPAEAGPIEIRAGISDHNAEGGGREGGLDLTGEVLFDPWHCEHAPDWFDSLAAPRPHIGFALNTAGDTSLAYAGLTWDFALTGPFFAEASISGAVHDGPLDTEGRASYGCRLNFRETAGLGIEVSPSWRLLLSVDHMSNADLCGRNRGLTNVGLRLGYRLN